VNLSGPWRRREKTRFAAGSLSCANDSTAAGACAVGVISPARAVVQGDSIPKSAGYITKQRWKSKLEITNAQGKAAELQSGV